MERRCILSGETGDAAQMIRLGLGPDDQIIPDLGGKVPGRGMWIKADRQALEASLAKKGAFKAAVARSTKGAVKNAAPMDDLVPTIERLMRSRILGRLGMETKAGRLATGYEKVAARLRSGKAAAVLVAKDAAADSRRKIDSLVSAPTPVVDLFDRAELSLAMGRENVVHAALEPGTAAAKVVCECNRLAQWLGKSLEATGQTH